METTFGDNKRIARRMAIIELLDAEKPIKVIELSKKFNISPVTVRKDLDMLENEGIVKRIHGGAVKVIETHGGVDYNSRIKIYSSEKKRIAKAAADLVQDGESVILNVGSTSTFVCDELKNKNHLIVITNALHLLKELADCKNITTFFMGGRFDIDMQITVGEDVIDQLTKYKADKLILGIDGINIAAGITSYNHVEDSIMRQMITQAKERILIADHSKIGKVTFAHIADLTDFNTLITDYVEENESQYDNIRALGLQVITV